MKKFLAPLLALALLGLCGCGETEAAAFRTLEVIGTRHYNVIYRKDDRLAQAVDAAMETLAGNGELSAISGRWLGRDAITLKGAAPAEAPEDEDAAEGGEAAPETEAPAPRTLIVGVENGFMPMAFAEGDGLRGMSIDIGRALGEVLGWEVAYQPIAPSEVGTQLSSGNIDCALGFDPAAVRADRYTVGVRYMDSDVALAARPGSDIRRLRDIRGQRVGTVDDPAITSILKNSERITRYASGATVYLSPERCISALDSGWCAAVAMDILMLEYMVQ